MHGTPTYSKPKEISEGQPSHSIYEGQSKSGKQNKGTMTTRKKREKRRKRHVSAALLREQS
jgi:ribosomal protein L2